MRIKALLIVSGVVTVGLLATFLSHTRTEKQDMLACTTKFIFTRNAGKVSEVKVNVMTQFYFHRDGTGITTYKGAASTRELATMVDRDVNFTWRPRNDAGIIELTYTKTLRRHNDNTPDNVWGDFARRGTRYYLTISEVAPSVWLIQDRKYPTYLCREE
ncbi:hypothetical protein FKD06_22665 [Serratia sp. SRS-8-S-2018]|nr:hypothetical protein C7M66_18095 [Serratia marcescens]TPW43490.1 hypothetical protein FKD06_22665 [Serratia sp. SRS-8-S-2018]AXX26192.1 hypothetical protein C7M65_19910 [Serratia marcescens]EIT7183301.1 hypothetical protein [Serratia marcescens]EJC6393551.1 hypothetical protein [Serratia marcescens]